MVCKMVPFWPAIHASCGSNGDDTANNPADVPETCAVQLLPPSLLEAIAPKSPTAKPLVGLGKATPNRVFVVAGFCGCQLMPSPVCNKAPPPPAIQAVCESKAATA